MYAPVNLAIIGSVNVLSPIRRQAIIWTKAGLLLVGLLENSQWNLTQYITLL